LNQTRILENYHHIYKQAAGKTTSPWVYTYNFICDRALEGAKGNFPENSFIPFNIHNPPFNPGIPHG
jgi:hypothetical protein